MQQQERTRIFSHITRTRFLHLEDSLDIGKLRFFIGQYKRRDQGGQGAEATAYHFLDDADARPLCADLSWAKPVDFTDYKGSASGDVPVSRVLKVRGPKDGKYWLEIQNGPGEIIGQGAVKPKGEPDASISIALSLWEARKLALAVIEYMTAYRVAALVGAGLAPALGDSQEPDRQIACPQAPTPAADVEALFGPEPAAAVTSSPPDRPQAEAKKEPTEDKPTAFYQLAPIAVTDHGLLDLVQELVKAPLSWSEKATRLQAAMAA